MLALHLLQVCLVYVNTLMIQQILAERSSAKRLTKEDLRALTPTESTRMSIPMGSSCSTCVLACPLKSAYEERYPLQILIAAGGRNVGFTP